VGSELNHSRSYFVDVFDCAKFWLGRRAQVDQSWLSCQISLSLSLTQTHAHTLKLHAMRERGGSTHPLPPPSHTHHTHTHTHANAVRNTRDLACLASSKMQKNEMVRTKFNPSWRSIKFNRRMVSMIKNFFFPLRL